MAQHKNMSSFWNKIFKKKADIPLVINGGNNTQYREFGSIPVYYDASVPEYYRMFRDSPHLFTVVDYIAERFSSVAWNEYKIKSTKDRKSFLREKSAEYKRNVLFTKAYDEVSIDSELGRLLMKPNETMSQDAFLKAYMILYALGGEAIIWLNRGEGSEGNIKAPILEMWLIPSVNIEVVPDTYDPFSASYYNLLLDGRIWKQIPKEDIIHVKEYSTQLDGLYRVQLRGISPLSSGRKWVSLLDSIDSAITSAAQNGGARGVLYETSGDIDTPMINRNQAEQDKIRQTFEAKINSNKTRDAVMYVSKGAFQYLDLGKTSRDMQVNENEKQTFERLCNLYKVPPVVFNSDTSFNNVRVAFKSFCSTVLIPQCSRLRDALNEVLPLSFGSKTVIEFDLSVLPEMQEDAKEQVEYLERAWWLTPNEKRIAMNYEPIKGLDTIFAPTNIDNINNLLNADTDITTTD